MTSVDELFKKSGLPSKRKLDPVRDPSEIYKSARTSTNGHSKRQPHVKDAAPEADDDDDDTEAGPARPPANDDDNNSDYGPAAPPADDEDDDEEGRFYGGGISKEEAKILDYVEGQGEAAISAAPDKIDTAWLRKTAINFEKRINKNAELRAKFEDDPTKFIASEADLDADIKALSILSEHPELYAEFARLGSAGSLVGLLAHENTDIAIDVLEILAELTDEDVAASEEQWDALVDAALAADLVDLLVSNLARLDESDEADARGVYHALNVVENFCSRTGAAVQLGKHDGLLKWLLGRIQKSEKPVSQNKQYAAEVLAILAQAAPANRKRLAALDAVDAMLQLVAAYRRRDPDKGSDEEEYMENLFEALTLIVDGAEGKDKFVEAEGVELCLIMVREGSMSRGPALRLLDYAAGVGTATISSEGDGADEAPRKVCSRIVEAGGLKTLFTAFMDKKGPHNKKKKNKHGGGETDHQATEHLLSIFASLLRQLPADAPERTRALAKFVEAEYEKTRRLLRLRGDYAARLRLVDEKIAEEEKAEPLDAETDEELREAIRAERVSRRLGAGLYGLQTVDVVLAWLVAEDDGAKRVIEEGLDGQGGLKVVRATIEEQLAGLEGEEDAGRDTRDMLATLVDFL